MATSKALSNFLFSPRLKALDINQCDLTESAIESIFGNLAGNGSIKEVRLGGNKIEGRAGNSIGQFAKTSKTLERLDLLDSPIDACIIDLAQGLANNSSIKQLKIDFAGSFQGMDVAAEHLLKNATLEELVINGLVCSPEQDARHGIIKLIETHGSITHLSVINAKFRQFSGCKFLKSLAANAKLECVQLVDMEIMSDNESIVGRIKNKSLKKLEMRGIEFGNQDGYVKFISSLRIFSGLSTLELPGNLPENCTDAVHAFLSRMHAISELEIQENIVNTSGFSQFVAHAEGLQVLKILGGGHREWLPELDTAIGMSRSLVYVNELPAGSIAKGRIKINRQRLDRKTLGKIMRRVVVSLLRFQQGVDDIASRIVRYYMAKHDLLDPKIFKKILEMAISYVDAENRFRQPPERALRSPEEKQREKADLGEAMRLLAEMRFRR